ncbi:MULTISPECIES: ABC transporter ATP-binding protein [Prochlorococcus]|uniref:ABC-type Mn/Zn transport system ATPase component n=1 Tax=Prochlorococcus marinus (strain SARG / CCMP1375 / SS120) TaxID=167539 RepID=Q7VAG0_PROMA|nr:MULTISPECIES: ABC transporter ATP-binding protein [Prochlorococcus]AAQ00547.1 ABC-type Mn/Zn transport system ATPase component [Prochlorococcus marinus subsp. marinus str. CCMP1375]KGG10281.1 Zinc ABC transporter [Prochlorococcus marinus str. LG]KGG22633.1 Zinc ABC transporter [Prochlorococcus marinus str. SS2]KGG24215.1 Zinc ABC transporter [Prochlorococcus marinus str. SS35]KGG33172.1 Zinc ABC transporter [Prochlorococcus marinus str. SS51]
MASLLAENLTYSYSAESKPVLNDVSIQLAPGTLTALVGPNGAGKSTLLRLLQGQAKPRKGQVNVDGKPLMGELDQIALMPQRGLLNWNFPITVEGLVSLGRVNHCRSACCELEAALQRVGISELSKRRLDSLSGGQQQKALLAKTLMRPASIFLLDEPCSSLDPPTREQFLIIIRQLADAGLTLFVSSHDWGKSLDAYDKVVALDKTVLASGRPQEVQEKLDSINCMSNNCCA